MSTHLIRKTSRAAKKRHRLAALRHRHAPARAHLATWERRAQQARAAAAHVRQVVQRCIVEAFRGQLEGSGAGPADADLLLFARLAVAEHRLGQSLAQIKAQRHRDARARAARSGTQP